MQSDTNADSNLVCFFNAEYYRFPESVQLKQRNAVALAIALADSNSDIFSIPDNIAKPEQ